MSGKKKLLLGVFVVGGILLFCAGLFIIGSRKQLFSRHFDVYTEFSDMETLQSGALVRLGGMDAGQVTAIAIPTSPSSKFRLTLHIDEKFHPVVRKDSITSIETAGMVGAKYVEVAQGSAKSPQCPQGGTLPSKQANGMEQLMSQGTQIANDVQATIRDLHTNADQTLQSFTDTARHVDGVVVAVRGNVEQIASNTAHVTDDVQQLTASVRQGQGVAGELLADQTVASDFKTTIANAKQTSANAEQASNNVDAIVTDFKEKDLPDVHDTLNNASDMSGKLDQAFGTLLAKGNNDVDTAVAYAMLHRERSKPSQTLPTIVRP